MSIKNLSSEQLVYLSIFSNSVETTIQHPLFVLKNRLQYNAPKNVFSISLYKGFFFNLYSLNSITVFQYISYGKLYKMTKSDYIASLTSGFLSGFIASPFEYCSINKKRNESLFNTIKRLRVYRNLHIGLFPTIIRESIYTYGLLTLNPLIEKKIDNKYKSFYSSIISGIISSVISHPFDTIKTYQQFHNKNIYPNTKILFNGLFLRSIRIINTFFIFDQCNKLYFQYI